MNLQKCKKEWDKNLYSFANKRYGKISNIGWYKIFMRRLDFIHDAYLIFISNDKNFEKSESYELYKKRFSKTLINFQKSSYRTITKKGREFEIRKIEFGTECNWESIANFNESDTSDNFDLIIPHLKNYKYVNNFYEGLTFVEVGRKEQISPVLARNRYLREIEKIKQSINEC